MAANPDRLELMKRAKLRKVEALRRKLSDGLRRLVADRPAGRDRTPG